MSFVAWNVNFDLICFSFHRFFLYLLILKHVIKSVSCQPWVSRCKTLMFPTLMLLNLHISPLKPSAKALLTDMVSVSIKYLNVISAPKNMIPLIFLKCLTNTFSIITKVRWQVKRFYVCKHAFTWVPFLLCSITSNLLINAFYNPLGNEFLFTEILYLTVTESWLHLISVRPIGKVWNIARAIPSYQLAIPKDTYHNIVVNSVRLKNKKHIYCIWQFTECQ